MNLVEVVASRTGIVPGDLSAFNRSSFHKSNQSMLMLLNSDIQNVSKTNSSKHQVKKTQGTSHALKVEAQTTSKLAPQPRTTEAAALKAHHPHHLRISDLQFGELNQFVVNQDEELPSTPGETKAQEVAIKQREIELLKSKLQNLSQPPESVALGSYLTVTDYSKLTINENEHTNLLSLIESMKSSQKQAKWLIEQNTNC